MTTPLSEVITYLNFDSTISIGETYETIKVILQEFGSMSISVISDQNLNFKIEFSNDSINFDYKTNQTIQGNVSETITTVILGKWCKLSATNASPNIANVRFTSYCQVIPIANQSQIEKEGNVFPTVNLHDVSRTLFNDIRIGERKPFHTHKFSYTTVVAGSIITSDRSIVQDSGGGIIQLLSRPFVVGNTLSLSDIAFSPIGSFLYVYGPPVVSESGNSIYVMISAGFKLSGYTNADIVGFDQMIVGMGYINNGVIVDGAYIGYPSAPVAPDTIVSEISFIYYGEGVETYIPRSRWFFDRLDGNGPSNIVLDEEKLSTWRIRGALVTALCLEYHNPIENSWIKVHAVQFENLVDTTNIDNSSFGFNMYTKRTSGAAHVLVSNTTGPKCAIGVVGAEVGQKALSRVATYEIEGIDTMAPAATETAILSIRSGPTINSSNNRSLIVPRDINLITDGTKAVTLKVYRNSIFAAPTWTAIDQIHIPTEILTNGSATIGTGYSIIGSYTGSAGTSSKSMSDVNGTLASLETLTVTVFSTEATNVRCLLNYSLVD